MRRGVKMFNLFLLVSVTCFFGIFMAGCGVNPKHKMTSGDFVYCYINKAGSNSSAKNGKNVAILQLTAAGKQKETIVIPDCIDGKPVVQIGMTGIGYSYSIGAGSRYKKLYLPKGIRIISDSRLVSHMTKVFLLNIDNLSFLNNRFSRLYLTNALYEQYSQTYGLDGVLHIDIANVTYVSNNETYWIDDCKDGEKLVAPIAPVRVGYTFSGWYKDAGFLNEWDFVNDVFDSSLASPTMMLYAKWLSI